MLRIIVRLRLIIGRREHRGRRPIGGVAAGCRALGRQLAGHLKSELVDKRAARSLPWPSTSADRSPLSPASSLLVAGDSSAAAPSPRYILSCTSAGAPVVADGDEDVDERCGTAAGDAAAAGPRPRVVVAPVDERLVVELGDRVEVARTPPRLFIATSCEAPWLVAPSWPPPSVVDDVKSTYAPCVGVEDGGVGDVRDDARDAGVFAPWPACRRRRGAISTSTFNNNRRIASSAR